VHFLGGITGGFLQAFSGQSRRFVTSEDASVRKESFELVCKFIRKLLFTMTGKNHDKMRYLENLKAICTHIKGLRRREIITVRGQSYVSRLPKY
jgi:hypothetical protein